MPKVSCENFGDRGEAIGGAGCVGNYVVFRGRKFVVDAEDEGGVGAVGGGGDDYFFYGAAQMFFGVGALGEEAGGLDDDIGADRRPIDFAGVFGLENFEAFAFDADGVFGVGDFVGQVAENRIVL